MFKKLGEWFSKVSFQAIGVLQQKDLKEMWLDEIQNRRTLEQLLILADHQRDELVRINEELEKIIVNYKKQVRNLKKELRKT